MPAKTKNTRTNNRTSRGLSLKSKPVLNKKILLALVIIIAAFGAWRIFFAAAAPNNCQQDSGINVCDVDQTAGGIDTILSVGPEALNLGNSGWGTYYGPPFRAPTAALKGAVPVYRIYNEKYTWHEYVTEPQKKEKESKYDGTKRNEGIAFYAWTSQVAGTVPVYRLTRGGGGSQSIYNSDKAWIDKIIAADANNPDGWKSGNVLPAIAFYAYPPNYKVANQANPYDCSIRENFLSDRCTMQRENLTKPTQTTTPARPSSPSTPTSPTQPTTKPGGSTPAAPVVSKPVTPAPAPAPSAPQYSTCPPTIEAYIDGVNRLKQNYHKDCHTWWWTIAKQRNDMANFYKAINDCNAQGKHFYDFKCNDYSEQEVAFFRAIDALRVNCHRRGGAWNAATNTCNEYRPALSQPLQSNNWTCKISGIQRIYGFGAGYSKRPVTVYPVVKAYNRDEAISYCVKWRSALNVQEQYQNFNVIDARLSSTVTGSW